MYNTNSKSKRYLNALDLVGIVVSSKAYKQRKFASLPPCRLDFISDLKMVYCARSQIEVFKLTMRWLKSSIYALPLPHNIVVIRPSASRFFEKKLRKKLLVFIKCIFFCRKTFPSNAGIRTCQNQNLKSFGEGLENVFSKGVFQGVFLSKQYSP